MVTCDKCGVSNAEDARFCSQCGNSLTEESIPEAKPTIAMVEISFGYSSSQYYSSAVSLCETLPSYRKTGEDKEARHTIILPITEIDSLCKLHDFVGKWKSSTLLINGQPATRGALTGGGISCYRIRQEAYDPQQYCNGENRRYNIWGCQALNMPFIDYADWLGYGTMDKQGVWHVDKERIRHELERHIHDWELCPVLDRKHIFAKLDQFPETINPKKDTNWSYITEGEEFKGSWREVAVGVKPNTASQKTGHLSC